MYHCHLYCMLYYYSLLLVSMIRLSVIIKCTTIPSCRRRSRRKNLTKTEEAVELYTYIANITTDTVDNDYLYITGNIRNIIFINVLLYTQHL